MKVKLKKCRHSESWSNNTTEWRESFPFAVNPRGLLTHRVRGVATHLRGGKKSHHSVTYLCGNCSFFSLEQEPDVLVEKPPKDRLLCSTCEFVAQKKKLPSGDKLAGRHVHVGVVRVHQACCLETKDRN